MARVLVLTDRAPDDADWKGAPVWRIILSLAESQHEVLVVCTRKFEEHPVSHPRLNVIRPVRAWRADQLPKLMRALLGFQPQVIHSFAIQDRKLWPALSIWPYFSAAVSIFPGVKRFSTIFDAEDYGRGLRSWHEQADRLTVFSEGHSIELAMHARRPIEIMPLDLEHENAENEWNAADPDLALIPAPVSEWKSPEENLRHVRDRLQRHTKMNLKIIGGWGDWEASRRRHGWEILGGTAARVNMAEEMSYPRFVDELRRAGGVWLEPLARNSWKFLLSTRLAQQLGKESFLASPLGFELLPGSTANSLSRLYTI